MDKKTDFDFFLWKKPKKTSFFSNLFFKWAYDILQYTPESKISQNLYPLPSWQKVENIDLSKYLKNHSIVISLILSNKLNYTLNTTIGIILAFHSLLAPFYIKLFVNYLSSEGETLEYGLFLAGSFTLIALFFPLLDQHNEFYMNTMVSRIRASLNSLIYSKMLMTKELPEEFGVNVLDLDVSKICWSFYALVYLPQMLVQTVLAIYFIYSQLGNAVWVAISTILLAIAGNSLLTPACKSYNEIIMHYRDQRIEKSTQFLAEIKNIKSCGYENYFTRTIQKIREKELEKLRFLKLLQGLNKFYCSITPNLAVVFILVYSVMVDNQELTSEKAFVTLSALVSLQVPLHIIPAMYSNIVQMLVSQKRIQKVMDLDPWCQLPNSKKISMKNCCFAYKNKEVLRKINLNVPEKKLTAVTGPVGSGKSSLLLAVIGEIQLTSGELLTNTNAAYSASFDYWLLNASLRDNILMGLPLRENWYWEVINACCLLSDIQQFPCGDLTEIGERGVNLSGGQKARVCLARAVYSDKEVYLLDDLLSSVDNRVANHVFYNCFLKLLGEKTRLIVTHQYSFLSKADQVIVIKNGEIDKVFSGNFSFNYENFCVEKQEPEEVYENSKLVVEEDKEIGEVNSKIYYKYFEFSGSYLWIIFTCVSLGLWQGAMIFADILLKNWTNNSSDVDYYLPLIIGLKLGGCIFTFLACLFLITIMSTKISVNSHKDLLKSLKKAPINLFYDITPIGRILNRLSKDINTVDENIHWNIFRFLTSLLQAIGCFMIGIIYFPYLVIVVPIITVPGVYICKLYIRSARELTRLESISRSPILDHFTQSLSGCKYIRLYGQVDRFTTENSKKINHYSKIYFTLIGCQVWTKMNLGFLSAIITSVLFITAVIFKDNISVSVVGLCLTYMMPLPDIFKELLLSSTDLENSMISTERIYSYTRIPQEKFSKTIKDAKYKNWPLFGGISFYKVSIRYRPNTPIVLNKLSFDIPPCSKVGIAGRTGSGKSSIFLSLLRIIEPETGVIYIDGVNIQTLGLKKLRKTITLIPQDPLIFNGTIKDNLDQSGQYTDGHIKNLLNSVGLKLSLDYHITNNGKNISVGERQLLSLCKAMTCNTKILLFDEATAGIDLDLDKTIRNIIKTSFQQFTVITIAHRLESIVENDLILLMENGKLKEIGPPSLLMSTDSEFNKIFNTLR